MAAFVGRNESGKTTILQALTLLNKEERVSELDLCDEMTEELKSEQVLVEGHFHLSQSETKLIKEKFPHLPEIIALKIFRTNKTQKVQYDFGDIKISEEKNRALNSWENYTEKILGFVSTIPNHIRIQIDTKFFEGPPPTDKDTFIREMTEFNNNLQVLAIDEQQILAEWSRFYSDREETYDDLLVGTTEKTALENFILEHLHPRFVYFSDYKKIYGNINLDEYIKEVKRPEGLDYEEFDKAETVRNLFYLAELDTEKLEEYKNSPPKLIKLLNAASRRLTDRLNPAWKGDPIHVDLRYNPGNIMSVVISDVHRDGTVTNTGLLSRRADYMEIGRASCRERV